MADDDGCDLILPFWCVLILAIPIMAVTAYGLWVMFWHPAQRATMWHPRRSSLLFILVGISFCAVACLLLVIDHVISDPPNYSRIEHRLYLGGRVEKPPRGTRAVLNLCESPDRYKAAVHLWEPIRDAEPAPDLDWLRQMVDWIDTQQRAGLRTYVHCRNGVSRSALVVTAYEMWKNRWTRDEALAFVRSQRPDVRPHPAFMKLLIEWEQQLNNERKP